MNKENECTSIEEDVKQLKSDIFWLKVILSFAVLAMGILAIGTVKTDSTLVAKTTEIASRVNVECVTKTNTLFGVLTKVKIVK
jgi:hypothetical protein